MLTLTTPAAIQPVTLAAAKRHARISTAYTAEDDDVQEMIGAAANKFIEETGYYLDQVTFKWKPDRPAVQLFIPARPVLAIVAMTTDAGSLAEYDAEAQTGDYTLSITPKGSGVVKFQPGVALTGLVIDFTAGAAPTDAEPAVSTVNPLAKMAIKQLVATWYNNREAYGTGVIVSSFQLTWQSIVRNFRLA